MAQYVVQAALPTPGRASVDELFPEQETRGSASNELRVFVA
jgi:hypothetical protein